MAEGFFDRWSRRKGEARQEGRAAEAQPVSPADAGAAASTQLVPAGRRAGQVVEAGMPPPQPSPGGGGSADAPAPFPPALGEGDRPFPPPLGEGQGGGGPTAGDRAQPADAPVTLDDVQTLTPQSDFRRFVARGVAPEVKNAAMKKLFADPHFNVMDGLDVYIDDYGRPDPLPDTMLKKLASAQFLGLLREDEGKDATPPGPGGRTGELPADSVAQSIASGADNAAPSSATPESDAHPDLRLQQDDAPAGKEPGRGTG